MFKVLTLITFSLCISIKADIQFDSTTYNFPTVQSGQFVKHTFVFTNTGSTKAYIDKVIPACGCTTVAEWTKIVEPGNVGLIPIQFNSYSYQGSVEKHILVFYDGSKTNTLSLIGVVHKPVVLTPPYLILNLNTNQEGSGTVNLHNAQDIPLTIYSIKPGNPAFNIQLTTNIADQDYSLTIKAQPPFIQGYQSLVRLFTSQTNYPEISFLVLCQPITKSN